VLVSNLWYIRDFWEWLAPGFRENKEAALSTAAFVSYEHIAGYRDFLIRREDSVRSVSSVSPGAGQRHPCAAMSGAAGLWARPYMTDPEYKYMGTLSTADMFQAAVNLPAPPVGELTDSEQKARRSASVAKMLSRVMQGPYAEQFTSERMADVGASMPGVGCMGGWIHPGLWLASCCVWR
jgi:hypothetical protein